MNGDPADTFENLILGGGRTVLGKAHMGRAVYVPATVTNGIRGYNRDNPINFPEASNPRVDKEQQ
jgi:hypothetical protein